MQGVDWVHATGITPAIGPGPLSMWQEAMAEAGRRGVPISFDLNHRPQLGPLKQLWDVVTPFLPRWEGRAPRATHPLARSPPTSGTVRGTRRSRRPAHCPLPTAHCPLPTALHSMRVTRSPAHPLTRSPTRPLTHSPTRPLSPSPVSPSRAARPASA
jgi:hypothetical protein